MFIKFFYLDAIFIIFCVPVGSVLPSFEQLRDLSMLNDDIGRGDVIG